MASVQRIAVVDPSDESRETLRNALLGLDTVWLEAECSRYEFFVEIIASSPPDVAMVHLDADPTRAIQLIQQVLVQYPAVDVVASSSRSDGPFILQVLRSGAKEFLSAPVQVEELVGALDRLRQGRGGKEGEALTTAKIYTFAGARGGVGCTSLAVNFGCILAQDPANQVVLVDLDLAMGDADVCLDIIANYTLYDVASNIERLDFDLLKRSLSKHNSGLFVLPHPIQIDDVGVIHYEHVNRVLNLLKMKFNHILVDLSKGYSEIDFAAMQMADEVLLVTNLDVSSLRNVVRITMSMSQRDGLDSRIKVIANRGGSLDNEISIQRAEETIGRPIFYRIPNDARTMMASRNNGVPLLEFAPKSKLFTSIQGLVDSVTKPGAAGAAPVKERRGFFFFGHD